MHSYGLVARIPDGHGDSPGDALVALGAFGVRLALEGHHSAGPLLALHALLAVAVPLALLGRSHFGTFAIGGCERDVPL